MPRSQWRKSLGPIAERVYLGSRDEKGQDARCSRDIGYEQAAACCADPLMVSIPEAVISLGEPGTFDDSGVMPSWLIPDGDTLRLYYVGWNVIGTVPYRLSIGCGIERGRWSHVPAIFSRTAHQLEYA